MNQLHEMRQYDRRPPLESALYDHNGSPTNLSTASSVTFTMIHAITKRVKIDDAAASIVGATLGQVRYNWAAKDTDTPGEYLGWFTVYWSASDKSDRETFPNGEEEFIHIYVTHGNDS